MQLISIFSTTLLSLANIVFADSPEFGIVSTHSASAAHLLSITDNNGLFLSGGPNILSSFITDTGKLKFSNGKYVVVSSDGKWIEGSESEGSTGFAIASGSLTYKGSSWFFAIPSSKAGSFFISETRTDDSIGVSLTAWASNGSRAADYTPSGNNETTSTIVAVSQIDDGQVQATESVQVQQENGAARNGFFSNVFAIAAALLF